MCQLWADNVYFVPNYKSTGSCVRTNLAPNTAMRSPGALQGIYMTESIIERVAYELKLDPLTIRQNNFYQQGQTTPYGQPIQYYSLPTCWSQLRSSCNYDQRVQQVQTFNQNNRWRKRGIRMTPVKYPMGLAGSQCAVLLNVFAEDGTIMLAHSGCEIGQGLSTKVAQAVAYELNIDLSLISITSTSTEKIPNFTNTGGSSTSESVTQAAINACQTLNASLAPIKKTMPNATWPQLIAAAANSQINLSVSGYFSYAHEDGNFPFAYFVFGAACTEAEVDLLTGEIEIIQTDIVYDCGISLNPAVDIGQVEGAFVQGIGFFFTEECIYLNGRLLNNGTWDYKPASSQDIPIVFNVTFLNQSPNLAPHAVLSSKATGEPPYQLAASAYFAVKDAIYAARAAGGLNGYVSLNTPITTDQIQLACGISINQLNLQP